MTSERMKTIVDFEGLPKHFPTHRHTAEFWEKLGRAIATYSFLEEILKKAIFALEFTKTYESEKERNLAYEEWKKKLSKNLTAQLFNLSDQFQKATANHQEYCNDTEEISKLVELIKNSSEIRNVLCHGSWSLPDDDDKSIPFFINKKLELFETGIDIPFLIQAQEHNMNLICEVMNWITIKGWKFPGWNNPGESII